MTLVTAHHETWTEIKSHSRKGILCALADIEFDDATLEVSNAGRNARLIAYGQVQLEIRGWDTQGIWPRLLQEDENYRNDTGHWADYRAQRIADWQRTQQAQEGDQ